MILILAVSEALLWFSTLVLITQIRLHLPEDKRLNFLESKVAIPKAHSFDMATSGNTTITLFCQFVEVRD